MTNKLKTYIERHVNWLESDLRRLVFQCYTERQQELLNILEEARIKIPELNLTKTELIQAFDGFQEFWESRNRPVEITIKNDAVRVHFKDSHIYQYSTLSDIIDSLEQEYVPRSLIYSDPDILQDYIRDVATYAPSLDLKYFGDNL